MGFAGAGSADEDSVALGVQEGAGGKLTHLALVNWRVGEGELVEGFQDRELGGGDAIADRPGLAGGPFCPDQAGDEWIEVTAPGHAPPGDLVEAVRVPSI